MRYSILALAALIPAVALIATGASGPERGLANRVVELEAQVAAMEEILQFVHVETEELRGMAGPHWIIEGANVHVRSGSGLTNDRCLSVDPDFPNCEVLTGMGNLIVGYNEQIILRGGEPVGVRTGSHNLVVGKWHSFSSFSGFVAGEFNQVLNSNASITGGRFNQALGRFSSVSGGIGNVASGLAASVSGGQDREAPDQVNWAAGDLFEED